MSDPPASLIEKLELKIPIALLLGLVLTLCLSHLAVAFLIEHYYRRQHTVDDATMMENLESFRRKVKTLRSARSTSGLVQRKNASAGTTSSLDLLTKEPADLPILLARDLNMGSGSRAILSKTESGCSLAGSAKKCIRIIAAVRERQLLMRNVERRCGILRTNFDNNGDGLEKVVDYIVKISLNLRRMTENFTSMQLATGAESSTSLLGTSPRLLLKMWTQKQCADLEDELLLGPRIRNRVTLQELERRLKKKEEEWDKKKKMRLSIESLDNVMEKFEDTVTVHELQ